MRKNIIVILCDQLRKDCLGCYGNEYVKTPNIDSLAGCGVKFEKNYVVNPICMPSRMSLFSGMYPRNHGLWTNGLLIADEGYTLMHHLSGAGYQTACIGKVHFEPAGCAEEEGSRESFELWRSNPKMDSFHGPYWGYDYIELNDCHHGITGHMQNWFYEHGGTDEMLQKSKLSDCPNSGVMSVPTSLHSSAFVGERSVNYIDNLRDKGKPFFLTVSFPDPHPPLVVPRDSVSEGDYERIKPPVGAPEHLDSRPEHYRQHLDGLWSRKGEPKGEAAGRLNEQQRNERICHTYSMIKMIDENVGKILDSLKRNHLEEDTIVVFTSDHGELLGDFGLWLKGPFFFEGLINTPLIISSTELKPSTSMAMFSEVDIVPTLCDMVGVETPFYCDGVSQKEVLTGKAPWMRESCMVEYRTGYGKKDRNSKVLIKNGYKYVRYEGGECELTDLNVDPQEYYNQSRNPQYSQVMAEMSELLLDELMATESKKPRQLSHA